MIGNSVKGRGFRGCLQYNLAPEKGAQIVGGNMAGDTARSLAKEFGEVRRLNQRVQTPCWHVSLSAVPGEKLSDAQWSQVADQYLDNMGFDRSQHQYVVVRHCDTRHQHVHIVANRVAMDGSIDYLKWHLKDTKKATRQLEQMLDYVQPTCIDPVKVQLEEDYQRPAAEPIQRRELIKGQYQRHRREIAQAKTPQPIMQQRLQEVVGQILPQSQTLDDFIAHLAAEGIEAKIRIRRERQVGISYRLDGVALRGTKLGDDYSWAKLQQHFEQLGPADQVNNSGANDRAEREAHEHPHRRTNVVDAPEGITQTEPDHAANVEVSIEPDRSGEATGTEGAEHRGRFAGLGDLAGNFAKLADPTDGIRGTADGYRGPDPAAESVGEDRRFERPDTGDVASPAADDGDVDRHLECDGPAVSESGVAAANVDGPDWQFGNSVVRGDAGDEPGFESGAAIDTGTDESVESYAGFSERETVGGEDAVRDVDGLGFGSGVDRVAVGGAGDRVAAADGPGAREREGEQSGDQPEETASAAQVEEQRLLVIAQGWSDEELLAAEREVEAYFKRQPSKPNLEEGEWLKAEVERLERNVGQLRELYREQKEYAAFLGPARSLKHPFGSPRNEVEAAQLQMEGTRRRLIRSKQDLGQAERGFGEWRNSAVVYQEWRDGDEGQKMHRYRDIIELELVQVRVVQVRQAQEKQHKKQEVMETLQQWQQVAIKLGKSEAYVQRIEEIIEDYGRGQILTEKQVAYCNQDFSDYRKQLGPVQARQRQRGFSL